MKAVLAAAMLIVAPMAASAGETSYTARHSVEYFVGSADLGAKRGICIGTAEECGLIPPQAQEQTQEQEQAREQAQEQAAPDALEVMVNFELDSDELSESAKADLLEFVKALTDPRFAEASFAIEGHTDATGSVDYNQRLSERRAGAVVRFLRQQGVDTSRFVVRGYGETRPRSDDPFDPVNRRAETRLLPQ